MLALREQELLEQQEQGMIIVLLNRIAEGATNTDEVVKEAQSKHLLDRARSGHQGSGLELALPTVHVRKHILRVHAPHITL